MPRKSAGLFISNGTLVVPSAANVANRDVLVTAGLTISGNTNAWTGTLDLGNNDLIVQHGSLATLLNQLGSGLNYGTGIVSAAVANDSTHLTALGIVQNSVDQTTTGSVLYSAFDGQVSTNADVLIKYTYFGDANLDGKVDGSDYSRIDNGITLGMTGWFNGDFNYDGTINGSDYTLIDNAFNRQGARLTAQPASPSEFVESTLTGNAAVPEPDSLIALAVFSLASLGRRSKNRKC